MRSKSFHPERTTTQHEVFLAFPVLQFYRNLPQKICWIYPFICVDNIRSAITGREVLGLPKLVGQFTCDSHNANNAHEYSALQCDSLSSDLIAKEIAKEGEENDFFGKSIGISVPTYSSYGHQIQEELLPVFRIEADLKYQTKHEPVQSESFLPERLTIDPTGADAEPGYGFFPLKGCNVNWRKTLQAAGELLDGFTFMSPRITTNSLMQIRSNENPLYADYQDLIESEWQSQNVNDLKYWGLGHFRIKVYNYQGLPLVKELGLGEHKGKHSHDDDYTELFGLGSSLSFRQDLHLRSTVTLDSYNSQLTNDPEPATLRDSFTPLLDSFIQIPKSFISLGADLAESYFQLGSLSVDLLQKSLRSRR
jgi:hypothetical protein